jgi:homogentisate 1,2-dioxygenase
MQDDLILIVDDESSNASGEKGWGDEIRKRVAGFKEVRLNHAELEDKMTDFLKMVRQLFQKAEEETQNQSGLLLTEVELAVEISGEGEIKLVAGGKAAGKSAIKLKFTRIKQK